ncbi:MAG: hypothetical protein ACYSWP_06965 [Planctomycetota bacterium]|jgi:hypothetical protein
MNETRKYRIVAVSLAISVISTGCGQLVGFGTPVSKSLSNISTVRYLEIRDPNAKQVDRFKIGEIPAIKIEGHKNIKVLFIIIDITTGDIVKSKSLNIRKGETIYWPLLKLEPGLYMVSLLTTKGTRTDRHQFSIEY